MVLPEPLGPTRPTFMPAVRMKFRPVNRRRGASIALLAGLAELASLAELGSPEGTSQATSVNSTRRLVLRWLASKSMPAELTVVRESMALS